MLAPTVPTVLRESSSTWRTGASMWVRSGSLASCGPKDWLASRVASGCGPRSKTTALALRRKGQWCMLCMYSSEAATFSLIQPVPVVVAIMITDRSHASVRSSSATARATCSSTDPADSNPT